MRSKQDPEAEGAALQVGRQVFLRRPTRSDHEEYRELRLASAEFHRPWEPTPPAGSDPLGADSFARFVEESETDQRVRTFLCSREDERIVGAMNWNEVVRGPLQSAYLGYWIGAPFARRGYMHEGLRLALRHSFEDLELHRVEANVRPENAASVALVRGAGFRLEGLSPRYLKIAGEWRDHERWAMLVDDWRALRARDS